MSNFHHAYLRAVDDLNAGRIEPVETYLELVPADEQDELAAMIADLLVARGPAAGTVDPASETYAAALTVIDEVIGSAGPSGVLPGALRTIRHARRIDPEEVIGALAEEYDITGTEGRQALGRFYHQLETGLLIGPNIAHRLLRSLSEYFRVEFADVLASVRPTDGPAPPAAVLGMGRPAGSDASPRGHARQENAIGPDPEVKLVEKLFTGGPDA
jgi:hypothetical protein